MDLTDTQIELIRDSYRRIAPESRRISGLFYKNLFNRDPRIEALFKSSMDDQGMRFMMAIDTIVGQLDNPDGLDRRVDELASGHAHFHIRPESYREMENALIDTIAEAMHDKFSSEIELAWRKAFGQIGDKMIARGRELVANG